MIQLNLLLLFIYSAIVLGTVIMVLLDRKEPVKTMAWLLVLFFLPIIGVILYFFFGQNMRKERHINRKSVSQLTKHSMLESVTQHDIALPEAHRELIQLFVNQNKSLPFKDNSIQIFTHGKQMFDSLLSDIKQAKKHIHLETYIFEDDDLGNTIADALIEKAHEGLEIRVLYDDVGCWNVHDRFFKRMKKEGVDIHSFMPVIFPLFTSKINYRNHRKICIIDGGIGYIGGMNIADRYVNGTKNQAWRDTHLKIIGKSVYGLQRTFLMDWYFMTRKLLKNKKYYPEISPQITNDCLVQIVASSSASLWPDIMQGYVKVLNNARRYVYLETPYFIPTQPILFAIQTAALSGIDVRIIVPAKGDNFFVDCACRSFLPEVLKAGAKVYYYKAGFNHSKILVSDDMLCSVGSTNIDPRSFENNMEVNAFIYDKSTAQQIARIVRADMRKSRLISNINQIRSKNMFVHLWDSIIRMLSPLL